MPRRKKKLEPPVEEVAVVVEPTDVELAPDEDVYAEIGRKAKGGVAPKWKDVLDKALCKADELLEHDNPRISGAMAQTIIQLGARTGAYKPGAGQDPANQGPRVVLNREEARRLIQGDRKIVARLRKGLAEQAEEQLKAVPE